MKFNLKHIFFLIFLFFVYIFICGYSYSSTISSELSDNILRLHVIANSDSSEDQNLKYLVRNSIIEYMNTICSTTNSKSEVIELVNNNIDNFKKIALNTISENGFNYPVNISIGNFYFPTKHYDNISLPNGLYDAVRVEIGNASGQNWWCVLFPSLCFIDNSSNLSYQDSLSSFENNLSNESFFLISSNNSTINFKFKIIEFFQGNKISTANK